MSDSGTAFPPPRCTFVTGATGAARLQWLAGFVAAAQLTEPGLPGAVLLAESGMIGARQFAARVPGVNVQWLALPCQCCPWLADLPRTARRAAEVHHARWLVIDVPPIAAGALLAEFDRVLGWPREIVVWLNREWSQARAADNLSPFQVNLLAMATRVVEERAADHLPPSAPSTLSLQPPP